MQVSRMNPGFWKEDTYVKILRLLSVCRLSSDDPVCHHALEVLLSEPTVFGITFPLAISWLIRRLYLG